MVIVNVKFSFLLTLSLLMPLGKVMCEENTNTMILIGGGNELSNSQASIEKNSKWIKEIFDQKINWSTEIAFTDGGDPKDDLYFHEELTANNEYLLLDYIFRGSLKKSFYSSEIEGNSFPATNNSVESLLLRESNNKALNNLLLIYQGHGLKGKNDYADNYLKLWNNSKLTVKSLANIFNEYDDSTTVRFLFPQCFSGAFANLIYKQATTRNPVVSMKRCGFVSQLPYLISEGCTPDIDTENYRDYSTYFFEALTGKQRNGSRLDENPDFNQDAQITLYEAHIYTLRNAYSIDYSKSTSEVYLENWQTPLVRWLPSKIDKSSIYFDVAKQLNSLFEEDMLKKQNRDKERATLKEEIHFNEVELKEQSSILKDSIKKAREEIIKYDDSVLKKYKANELGEYGYPSEVKGIVSKYSIKSLITKVQALEKNILQFKRTLVQVNKIENMLNLSRIQSLFKKYSTESEQEEYNKLLSCESYVLK